MLKLIEIGNSKGIRIPKALIEAAHLEHCELQLELQEEGLLIKPCRKKPRAGWDLALQKADAIEVKMISNQFDTEEWEWVEK